MLARALLAQGRPRRRRGAGAPSLAQRGLPAPMSRTKCSTCSASLLTRADHKARMEQRFYADDVEAGMRAANRLGGDDLAIGHARAAVIKQAEQCQGAARRGAGRRAPRFRLHFRARAMAAQRQQAGGSRQADPHRAAGPGRAGRSRSMVGGAAPAGAQAARRRRSAAPPTAWRATPPRRRRATTASTSISPPAGSRCASCTIRRPPPPISRTSRKAPSIRMRWRAAAIGKGARPRPWASARRPRPITRWRRNTPRPITASWRARGWGSPSSACADRRRSRRRSSSVLDNLEVVRAAEILYALNERDMLASIFAELGESGTDIAGMAALGEVAGKHDDGRAMLLLGKSAYGRGLPLDYYAYPIVGLPDYKPIAPPIEPAVAYSIARQESHFNQKVVSSRPCHGPDAGDAGGRQRYRQEIQGDLQPRPPAQAIRSTTCRWARPSSPTCSAATTAPISSPSPATMPGAAACGSGSPPMAIRAIRRSIRSTGSSASRSPRPAITCSGSWRTCRSIAPASAAAAS